MNPYKLPLICWLSACVGLVLALLGSGPNDYLALALLCIPLVLISKNLARS